MDRAAWFGGVEHFDDDPAPPLTGGAFCQESTGEFLLLIAIIPSELVVRRHRLRHGEKLTTPREAEKRFLSSREQILLRRNPQLLLQEMRELDQMTPDEEAG